MVLIIIVLIMLDRRSSWEALFTKRLTMRWTRNARAAYTRGRNVRYEYD
jgi:hypothetical protein